MTCETTNEAQRWTYADPQLEKIFLTLNMRESESIKKFMGEQNSSPRWRAKRLIDCGEGSSESARKVWVQDIFSRKFSELESDQSVEVDQCSPSFKLKSSKWWFLI